MGIRRGFRNALKTFKLKIDLRLRRRRPEAADRRLGARSFSAKTSISCVLCFALTMGVSPYVQGKPLIKEPRSLGGKLDAPTAPSGTNNPDAPRAYFPQDITNIAKSSGLPDLFTFFDKSADPDGSGTVDNMAEWAARRAELSDLMQYYLYGHKHITPEKGSTIGEQSVAASSSIKMSAFNMTTFAYDAPADSFTVDMATYAGIPVADYVAKADYKGTMGAANDWKVGDTWDKHTNITQVTPAHSEYVVNVADPTAAGKKTAQFKLSALETPKKGVDTSLDGPYPFVIAIGALSAEQVTTLKQNGYGYISMDTGSVYSDGGNNPHTGAYNELYPYKAGVYEYDSGTLMGWAWGVSRVIDAVKNDAELKYNLAWDKTAVTGCSRNGKAAVMAAAFDERVSVAAPSDPGGGGLTGFRYTSEGETWLYNAPDDTIYSRNETTQRAITNGDEKAWFSSKAQEIAPDKYEHIPFDAHAVAALVAPRPLICWTGETQQSWLNSPSTVLSVKAATEVYELLGAGGNAAVIVRDGAHANQDRDLPDLIAIMDKTFGRSDTITRKNFASLKDEDGRAADNSGMIYPEKTFESIKAMTRVPFDLLNNYVKWSRPGKSALWSDDTFITAGLARNITIHTDADKVTLTLPDKTELFTDVIGGEAVFALTAYQTAAGRYRAETADGNSVEFAGITLSDALRHGLNISGGSPDGMAVGFSSPITNYADGTVEAYVGGKKLTMSIYDDYQHQSFLERFGVSLKMSGAPEGSWNGTAFTFSLRNVNIEALPGYTLWVDVSLKKDQVANWTGRKVNGFSSALGETPVWLSSNVQNTPLWGGFNGSWPLYPNNAHDNGTRPAEKAASKPFSPVSACVSDDNGDVTFTFTETMNTSELGIAAKGAYKTAWSNGGKTVKVSFAKAPVVSDVILFRAVSAAGKVMSAPYRHVSAKGIPSKSALTISGNAVSFPAYNIEGYNWLKLRDVAALLTETGKRFEIGFNTATNTIALTTGKPYTAAGGELEATGAGNKRALASPQSLTIDGKAVGVDCYNIGGYNYFKLRDIARLLDFEIILDSSNNITLDFEQGYSGN